MASSSSSIPTSAPNSQSILGLIGGSSFLDSQYLASFSLLTVVTPFGPVVLRSNQTGTIYFVQRHAASPDHPYSPPHLINKRAILHALEQLKCTKIIAFGSVGSLKKSLAVGSLVIPDDWYDIEPVSAFEYSKQGHCVPGFDDSLRNDLISLLRSIPSISSPLIPTGVYVQTRGPRFETPAEIRVISQVGDVAVVGMTCAHEASLARERKLPYAVVCMVDNMANGLAEKNLTEKEFHDGVKRNLITMETVLGAVMREFGGLQIEEEAKKTKTAAGVDGVRCKSSLDFN